MYWCKREREGGNKYKEAKIDQQGQTREGERGREKLQRDNGDQGTTESGARQGSGECKR